MTKQIEFDPPREAEGALVTAKSSLPERELSPMEMMAKVLENKNPKDAVEVVKELAKLQMEMQARDAEIEFNQAHQAATAEMKMVINDVSQEQANSAPGKKKWATYRALNQAAKPIWIKHGLSVSWSSETSPLPDQMIVIGYVSKGLHTRRYAIPMDISGKGPKGDGAMSKPHAIGAGLEYARRDLIRMIFDLITGEEDVLTNGDLMDRIEEIGRCETLEGLREAYKDAYANYDKIPAAVKVLLEARNKRQKELERADH